MRKVWEWGNKGEQRQESKRGKRWNHSSAGLPGRVFGRCTRPATPCTCPAWPATKLAQSIRCTHASCGAFLRFHGHLPSRLLLLPGLRLLLLLLRAF